MPSIIGIGMIILPEMIPDIFRNIFILSYFSITQQLNFQKGTLRVIAHCLNKCTVKTNMFNCSALHKLLSLQFLPFSLVFRYEFCRYGFCKPSVCKDEFAAYMLGLRIAIYIAVMNTGDAIGSAFFSVLV